MNDGVRAELDQVVGATIIFPDPSNRVECPGASTLVYPYMDQHGDRLAHSKVIKAGTGSVLIT
jgi:hypothetical protein